MERNSTNKSAWKYVAISMIAILVIAMLIVFAPQIRGSYNNWRYDVEKVDDVTDYETIKKVEDNCRAYIASYEADKITYESMKDSTDEVSIETARAAKTRANRTAATYNTYYLQNSFVWRDNIPSDIKRELPYLE